MTEGAAPGSTSAPVLEAQGLGVRLGGARVLDGVDLRVEPGEMVALLGANGSGKSTLLRALLGVQTPSAGRALLFGHPARHRGAHDRLGYVPQATPAAGSIPATVRETVTTGLIGSRSWFPRSRDPRVDRALAAVGLEDLDRRPVPRMSGGQRRRVMIARALVREPELLVLDEPFAGVDLATQKLIAELFRELSAAGTTVLVVLHETGALSPDLDRVVVLDHGRVVHDGAEAERPPLDPGHDHLRPHEHIDTCLGQEIHPA